MVCLDCIFHCIFLFQTVKVLSNNYLFSDNEYFIFVNGIRWDSQFPSLYFMLVVQPSYPVSLPGWMLADKFRGNRFNLSEWAFMGNSTCASLSRIFMSLVTFKSPPVFSHTLFIYRTLTQQQKGGTGNGIDHSQMFCI